MVVMDGVGLGAGDETDAVAAARTPTLDWLRALPSSLDLSAHGLAVGMPSDADMGNSEVGHNAIGAGRVFAQGAKLVAQALVTGELFRGATWKQAVARVRASGEPLHFLGLLSDGNVHSHIDHLLQMIEQAATEDVAKVRVHVLLDGRDVDVRSALTYIDRLESTLATVCRAGKDYRIASGGGRMLVTMDRYGSDWSMVERGWKLHVQGEGRRFASARAAVETLYDESDVTDQWLEGFVIADEEGPVGRIRDGAAVLLFNFRGDRAIEISRAFEEGSEFGAFDRGFRPDVLYAGMMQYDGDLQIPRRFLVEPPIIDRTMGELLAGTGRRQLAIAETHKFGHVTYFWNGNRSGKFEPSLETYIDVASDILPLEQRPWMKAAEVTDRLLGELAVSGGPGGDRGRGTGVDGGYDLVRVNYANGDMIGHTGDFEATRMAVEAVDRCLARLVVETRRRQGVLLVTADHGNADHMFDLKNGTKNIRTSHSLNPVPFAVFDPRSESNGPAVIDRSDASNRFGASRLVRAPGLANLAATALELLGLQAPEHYDPSLLAPER